MGKGTHFIGQPKAAGAEVAGPPPDHRLHNHHAFLQPAFQGRGAASENGQEERRHKGPRQHTRQRHQDTDMGHANSQPAAHGHTEAHQAYMELLGTGHYVQDHAHVLCQLLHLLRRAGKGLAGDTQDNRSITPRADPV